MGILGLGPEGCFAPQPCLSSRRVFSCKAEFGCCVTDVSPLLVRWLPRVTAVFADLAHL